jgi:uncharacterized protein (TIGR02246 family)
MDAVGMVTRPTPRDPSKLVDVEGGASVREDEDHVRRTLAEYSRFFDDGRVDEWADLFTEDARFVVSGQVTEGRDAIGKYMTTVHSTGGRGLHVTTNTLVDVDGETATATTDYLYVRPTAAGLAIISAGRYDDRLVRDGRRWRFAQREITMLAAPEGDSDD